MLHLFWRIPFGLTNGVACFQRTINEILKAEGNKDTLAYINNVIVCGCTKADHEGIHDRLFKVAKKYG